MKINYLLRSFAIGAFAIFTTAHATPSYADIFKSSEFLLWEPNNRSAYIDTSVGMASLIAAQNDKTQAKCIDDWYYGDADKSTQYIENVMRDYPDLHPRGVILASVEKQCGKF